MLNIAGLCVWLLGYVGLYIVSWKSLLFLVICSDKAILQHSIYATREVGPRKLCYCCSSHACDLPVQLLL